MNIIAKIVVGLAIAYLLLQVGRGWGRSESFDNYYEQGRSQAKHELKMYILNGLDPFWFGDVRVDPKTKIIKVRG